MSFDVHATGTPQDALAACAAYLEGSPVAHNVALSILTERIAFPSDGRYWWVTEGADVVGYAWQSPTTFSGGVTPMRTDAVQAVADVMRDDVPALPGVIGDAGTAAAFAGRWTERTGTGARPREGQRIYELVEVQPAADPGGALRRAGPDDAAWLVDWTLAFFQDIGVAGEFPDVDETIARRIELGMLWAWHNDGPACMAMVVPPLAGACRVGVVYTPPERRCHGYAAALVAAVSQRALDQGASCCLLYTQLDNASSNGIYRRVGYRAVGEVLSYRFDQ
jgi:ribosomal protein S18 acetylase RimI-like enzyme